MAKCKLILTPFLFITQTRAINQIQITWKVLSYDRFNELIISYIQSTYIKLNIGLVWSTAKPPQTHIKALIKCYNVCSGLLCCHSKLIPNEIVIFFDKRWCQRSDIVHESAFLINHWENGSHHFHKVCVEEAKRLYGPLNDGIIRRKIIDTLNHAIHKGVQNLISMWLFKFPQVV